MGTLAIGSQIGYNLTECVKRTLELLLVNPLAALFEALMSSVVLLMLGMGGFKRLGRRFTAEKKNIRICKMMHKSDKTETSK
eukprot:5257878-Amphidinium_carterae.3